MGNHLIGTVRLSGEESINFVNSLFRPSQEMIEHRNKILNEIDSGIAIRRNEDSFEADIDDLDLSFLDDKESNRISMVTTVKLNTSKEFCNENNVLATTTVGVKNIGTFVKYSSYLNNAA